MQGHTVDKLHQSTRPIRQPSHLTNLPLVLQLLVFLASGITADPGLHPGDDLGQAVVTHFFKLTQSTGLEEDLLVVVNDYGQEMQLADCRLWFVILAKEQAIASKFHG